MLFVLDLGNNRPVDPVEDNASQYLGTQSKEERLRVFRPLIISSKPNQGGFNIIKCGI
jgi:hypothetical protein